MSLPIATDLLPKVSELKACLPIATLSSASVKSSPAFPPMRVFRIPVVRFAPAL